MTTTRTPLTAAELQYLARQKEQGATHGQVALDLKCSDETVRKHWRRLRRKDTVARRGRPARGVLSTFPTEMTAAALTLKRSHRHQGPINIRLALQKQFPQAEHWPSPSRLAELFKTQAADVVQPHRRQQYPNKPLPAVTQIHYRWQIDGKEKVQYGDDERATILNGCDPVSGVIVISRAYRTTTPKGWRKLTRLEVQTALRQAFAEWGLPCEIQTDHEVVYTGSPQSDFPSQFTLWLIGLGLKHAPSRERRPTDQAHIERTHRTLGDFGWKDEASATLERLQDQQDHSRQHYNYDYPTGKPTCQGQPPLVADPHAVHSGRPFDPNREWLVFDMTRVEAYLATQVWQRLVSDSGNVGVGAHLYNVGRAFRHQHVAVRYNAVTHSLRFETSTGELIKELPPQELSQADLIGYLPVSLTPLAPFQLALPWVGV